MSKRTNPSTTMEITIISAEYIKNKPSHPFITLSTSWPQSTAGAGDNPPSPQSQFYRTTPDDRSGGMILTWDEKFRIPISDNVLFYPNNHYFYIRLFCNRLIKGKIQLGWCQIPVSDVIPTSNVPVGFVRRLSYRLRNKDGSRGDGVVNIGVEFDGSFLDVINPRKSQKIAAPEILPVMGFGEKTVIGIPVGLPSMGFSQDRRFGYRWDSPPEERR